MASWESWEWRRSSSASGGFHSSAVRSTYTLVYKAQHCINKAHQKVSRGVT